MYSHVYKNMDEDVSNCCDRLLSSYQWGVNLEVDVRERLAFYYAWWEEFYDGLQDSWPLVNSHFPVIQANAILGAAVKGFC